jgi:hypothetical protein
MAITTLANVKIILGISVSTYDTLISTLIPIVEKEFISIRGKDFDTVVKGDKFGVGDGETKTFTLTNKPILSSPYESDTPTRITQASGLPMTIIYIGGTAVTSSAYSINLTTGVVTFVTAPAEGKRLEADYEAVNPVYPDGSELTAAQMIGYRIAMIGHSGEKSESLGDHSRTFEKDNMLGGYPKSITGAIERFVKFT